MTILKKFWKKLKYWQKGAIVGGISYGLFTAIFILLTPIICSGWSCFDFAVITLSIPVMLEGFFDFLYWDYLKEISTIALGIINGITLTSWSVVVGTSIGAIIGFIISKVKSKK